MGMTPGVELVWILAGSEAVAAERAEVEPEHFFCALLKLAEIGDETARQATGTPELALELVAERDRVRAVLARGSIESSATRRELRRLLGRGQHRHGGEAMHRSEASRAIFERAMRRANRERERLAAFDLLEELLASPTPAMARVMGAPAPSAERAVRPSLDDRLLRQVAPHPGTTPAGSAPQVRVIAHALADDRSQPILLVCDEGVAPGPVVEAVAAEIPSPATVIAVDRAVMASGGDNARELREQVLGLAESVAQRGSTVLFLDLTAGASEEGTRTVTSALGGGSAARVPPTLLAVSCSLYEAVVMADPELEDSFRPIWLHDLEETGIPDFL